MLVYMALGRLRTGSFVHRGLDHLASFRDPVNTKPYAGLSIPVVSVALFHFWAHNSGLSGAAVSLAKILSYACLGVRK